MHPHFLGVPDVGGLLFSGLAGVAFLAAFAGSVMGAGGGVMLLGVLAMVFPPGVLIPIHTLIQLGTGSSRAVLLRRYVMYRMLPPFLIGAALGATLGAELFVALPVTALEGILGGFILVVAWMPKIGRVGPDRGRFAALGFGTTLLSMFVSATGSLVAPFVASAAPDRRNHTATLAALMTLTHITKLIAFGILGLAVGAYLPLVAAMVAASVLGNWVGRHALDRIPEKRFRLVLRLVLTALSLRLLWAAATGSGPG